MATLKSVLRVFLSSPGDVNQERDVVRRAIYAAGQDPLISSTVSFECVAWDNATAVVPMSMNQTPQDSVNQYIVRPKDCDLTIVILWSRLGTPLPADINRANGSRFESGTIWELEDALDNGKPVWLYQKTSAPQVDLDDPHYSARLEQYKAMTKYIARSCATDGSLNYGVNRFDNDEQLYDLVSQQIRHFVKGSGALSVSADFPRSRREDAIEQEPPAKEIDIINQAVAAAVNVTALDGKARVAATASLLQLQCYPVGPMIRDVQVASIAEAIADMLYGEDVRPIFAKLNSSITEAAKQGDPALRVPLAQFSTLVGSKNFWIDVFYYCAAQGPRVLAALLNQFRVESFEGAALREATTLIERVNHYAE